MKRYEPREMCLFPEYAEPVTEMLRLTADTSTQVLTQSMTLHFMDGTQRKRKAKTFGMRFTAGAIITLLGTKINTEHYLILMPNEFWVIVEVRPEAVWYLYGDLYEQ